MKYVLDTNVLLGDPHSTTAFAENHVIIPFKVLEELDSIKQRKVDLSRDARFAIRMIEGIIEGATHDELSDTGVPIQRSYPLMPSDAKLFIITSEETEALIRTKYHSDPRKLDMLTTLIKSDLPDDKIILAALASEATLVTRDINMRIKALAYGVPVEDYRHDITITDSDLIHTGHHHYVGSIWDDIKSNLEVATEWKGKKQLQQIPVDLLDFPVGMCMGDYLYDDADALFVYTGSVMNENGEAHEFINLSQSKALNTSVWKIKARNIKQAMAINSMLDPEVHITVLLGSAGTGKTLLTIATALQLTYEVPAQYERIIFTKTQDSQFEDIGFLPGSEEDKVLPFCGAAVDALEYLHSKDANPAKSLEYLMDQGKFQFRALNFVRGRSFMNTFLIVDEFQNITPAMAKTILTRAGQNCKVVILGNLSQIDNQYITPVNSGLTYVTEKFKEWEGCRIIELEGVVRSELADFAEKNL